jgi:DNA-binding NtrC family response regulator
MDKNYKILIADDEPVIRELLKNMLKETYIVDTVERGDVILDKLSKDTYDILILDLQMPGMTGIEVLKKINEINLKIVVVIVTATKDVENAILSMKLGAYDYLVKPFDNEKLLIIIKNICDKLDLEKEVNKLREQVGESFRFKNIIGKSREMQRVFSTLEKVIDTDSTILIIGESGTGKEIIAKAVHYNSNRKQYPFRSIDCSTIPQELIGSELFGHEKGAFTGAIVRKIGKFEVANKGTLFLDEISNLSIDMQSKLLRVLQEKEFERVGGNQIIRVNTRIVAATNRDLRELVKENRFREDLYYRLNVVPIYLPQLKERKDDIPLFINHFISRFNSEYDKKIDIELSARILLSEYSWPGNVRQLENVIKRLVLLSTDKVVGYNEIKNILEFEENGLPPIPSPTYARNENTVNEEESSIMSLDEVEKEHLERVLRKLNYNISNTARALKISRKTMHNKLKKYNIVIKKSALSD